MQQGSFYRENTTSSDDQSRALPYDLCYSICRACAAYFLFPCHFSSSISSCSRAGLAPIKRSTTSPPLRKINVGMALTLYLAAADRERGSMDQKNNSAPEHERLIARYRKGRQSARSRICTSICTRMKTTTKTYYPDCRPHPP